ncbi:MAG: hypothetical protein H6719_25135 [Sandaracinaceae bacterium]|nr:hypothetical protein [Sandaracinaceae bacterium]
MALTRFAIALLADHDPGAGRTLWVRGSVAPLSWTAGWPMHALAPGRWRLVATELTGAIELEVLVDDATWQTGENATMTAGEELLVTPSF